MDSRVVQNVGKVAVCEASILLPLQPALAQHTDAVLSKISSTYPPNVHSLVGGRVDWILYAATLKSIGVTWSAAFPGKRWLKTS